MKKGKRKLGMEVCCDGKGVRGSAPHLHVPNGTWAKAEGLWELHVPWH